MVGLRCISLATLALNDALLVRGFAVAPHNIIAHTRTFVDKPSFQRNNLPLHSRGNDEEDASLDLDQTVAASAASAAADSLNVTVAVDSVSGGNSFFSSRNVIAIVSVAALLALSQVPQMRVLALSSSPPTLNC